MLGIHIHTHTYMHACTRNTHTHTSIAGVSFGMLWPPDPLKQILNATSAKLMMSQARQSSDPTHCKAWGGESITEFTSPTPSPATPLPSLAKFISPYYLRQRRGGGGGGGGKGGEPMGVMLVPQVWRVLFCLSSKSIDFIAYTSSK